MSEIRTNLNLIIKALNWVGCMDELFVDKMEADFDTAMNALDHIEELLREAGHVF
jgi:hypothetical protein